MARGPVRDEVLGALEHDGRAERTPEERDVPRDPRPLHDVHVVGDESRAHLQGHMVQGLRLPPQGGGPADVLVDDHLVLPRREAPGVASLHRREDVRGLGPVPLPEEQD